MYRVVMMLVVFTLCLTAAFAWERYKSRKNSSHEKPSVKPKRDGFQEIREALVDALIRARLRGALRNIRQHARKVLGAVLISLISDIIFYMLRN